MSKIGSDVNRLYFDVLPALQAGVYIHIHDVAGNLGGIRASGSTRAGRGTSNMCCAPS